ncbi:MAG: inositol monophosphatase family protein [Pseudomonadota bacterium]
MSETNRSTSISPALAEQLYRCACDAADAAARETLRLFRAPGLEIENKDAGLAGDQFDPVTLADTRAEAAIRAVLAKARPDDAIFGEEMAARAGTTGLTWTIDPIDGTRAFVIGAPTWGTLIAVSDGQGPILGLIDQPYTGERWIGGLGYASFVRSGVSKLVGARQTAQLGNAILCTTFPEVGTPAERAIFERLSDRVQLTRYGLDCYAYALVASGGVDLVLEAGLKAYDICAPIAVIEAAGGIVSDWAGGPAYEGGRVLAASNAKIHAEALEVLKPL